MDEIIYLIQKFLTFVTVPFLEIVNISITAGWIVLAVFVLRLLFRKAPKWLNCVLWGIVALRLIFPFSIESVFSLIPSAQTIDPTLPYLNEFKINSGIEPLDNAVNTQYADFVPMAERTVDVTIILACIWLLGLSIMLLYALASWARLKRSLKTATKKEGNIYQSEFVQSPFVLGIIKPKIYIPYKTNEADLPLVIAHEKAHIKRLDHLIKPLGFVLLSIYWFNPLLWVAYILLCRDIEAACDERVIKQLTDEQRKDYSVALLNASISRKSIAACPLAFGETGVKERIKGVMNYKKPAFWVIIAAVVVCVIAAVCFLTNPTDTRRIDYSPNISNELDTLIRTEIINYNKGNYLDGEVSCAAFKVLATETVSKPDENGIAITVYLVSSYNEYSTEDGKLIEMGGNGTPLALSFVVNGEDSYALYDYWEPGMGSSYIKDLQAKFPTALVNKVIDGGYSQELIDNCKAQAIAYFGLNPEDVTVTYSDPYTTVMLEAKKDYELTVERSKTSGVTWMTDVTFYKKNGFHAYLYCLDKAYVTLGSKSIYIGDALNSEKLYVDTLLKKAEEDVKNSKAKTDMLKDGGTKFYWYDGYTIIKRNTVDGNKDLIITYADISTTEYSAAVKFISGSIPTEKETTTTAVKKPRLIVNGQEINANGYIEFHKDEQYVMLPLFTIVKALGATVENPTANEVTIKYNGNKYVLKKDKNSLQITTELNDFNYLAKPPGTAHGAENYASGNEFLMYNECLTYFLYKEFNAQLRYDYDTMVVQVNSNNDIVGVTAPVGYNDEPHFDAVIIENNGSSLLVEAYGKNSGITQGSQAYVSLKSVLSHIELPEMEKGDKVRFIYDGTVQETYPLQIPTVWAVYELKE